MKLSGIELGVSLGIFLICGGLLGFSGTRLYDSIAYEREWNGLYLRDRGNWSNTIKEARNIESNGDWVCVNIRDMDYETAVKTCEHEVGHEIFAEKCEEDIGACIRKVS